MGLDDDIAILAAAPVFELFERDALRLLSFAGDRRLLGEGELLFARGEPSVAANFHLTDTERPKRGTR